METLKSLLGFDCQSTVVVIPNKDLHSVLPHCFRRGLFTYAIGGICVLNCFFVCLFVCFFLAAAAASSFPKLDVFKRSERTCTTSSIVNR